MGGVVNNLVGDRIFAIRDVSTKEVYVIDGLIDAILKDPLKADVKSESESRLAPSWRVDRIPLKRDGSGSAVYGMILFKNMLEASENMRLLGWDNNEHANGTCALEHR